MFRKYLPELKRRSQDSLRPVGIADLMEDFWKSPFELGAFQGGAFQGAFPAVDIAEDKDGLTVKAELPGMEPKDIDVSLENGILTIRGEKRFEDEEKKDDYHRIERSYGSFSRSFQLPHEVDPDKVRAQYKDGVLTLNLAKSEAAKSKHIAVEG